MIPELILCTWCEVTVNVLIIFPWLKRSISIQSIPLRQFISVSFLSFQLYSKDQHIKERQEKNSIDIRILFSYLLILLLYCIALIPHLCLPVCTRSFCSPQMRNPFLDHPSGFPSLFSLVYLSGVTQFILATAQFPTRNLLNCWDLGTKFTTI